MELYEEYVKTDFTPILVNKINPKRYEQESDKLARIAAMITNIDENVGRLFAKLNELGLSENTIVVYLNDNGPNSMRFVGNMRGMKTHVDDGGIRSPLLFHWPAKVSAERTSSELCAHIDLLPTILDACDVAVPAEHHLDGRSFLPLLTVEDAQWPSRHLVFQSHRGNEPQLFHHFALHHDNWKLVHPTGFGNEGFKGTPSLELNDLSSDPRQQHDVSSKFPAEKQQLKKAYEAWFADVSSTRPDNYAPPRIVIGTDHEPVTVLTRQDWRHVQGRPWAGDSNGFWLLENPEPTTYDAEVIFASDLHPSGTAVISAGDVVQEISIAAKQQRGHTTRIKLPAGKLKLAVDVDLDGKMQGPHQVILTRVGS
jgi:arylsulfatase A-like enzyme